MAEAAPHRLAFVHRFFAIHAVLMTSDRPHEILKGLIFRNSRTQALAQVDRSLYRTQGNGRDDVEFVAADLSF